MEHFSCMSPASPLQLNQLLKKYAHKDALNYLALLSSIATALSLMMGAIHCINILFFAWVANRLDQHEMCYLLV